MNMFIKLYNYFCGTIQIEIFGEFSERFLNILAAEKIKFWKVKKINEYIYVECYKKDILKIKKLRRKAFVTVKIISKFGFPLVLNKYKNRYGIAVGIALFFILLLIFSNHLWVINVNGNKDINSKEVINSLYSLNVTEGMKLSKIDTDVLKQKLILSSDNISWASLNIEGCVLNVNISEFNDSFTFDNPPCNLIALSDGIITKMNIHSGNYVVRIGQTVTKGQVLVSGITTEKGVNSFIHSSGEIFASVPDTVNITVNKTFNYKSSTGEHKNKFFVKIFNCYIPLNFGDFYGNFNETFSAKEIHLFGEKIPIKIIKHSAIYIENKQKQMNYEEAYNYALKELEEKLKNQKAIDYRILNTKNKNTNDEFLFTFNIRKTVDIAKKEYFKIIDEN